MRSAHTAPMKRDKRAIPLKYAAVLPVLGGCELMMLMRWVMMTF